METIRTIKGFDNELKCRGYQYEVGKTYTAEGEIKVCSNGFHAIRNDVNPLSVFEYYNPVSNGKPSRYCVVECSGEIDYDDKKLCSSIITIIEEITLNKLHELSQSWVESHSNEVQRGGDGSSLRGGDWSSLRGGDRSSLIGGDRSSLIGGYRSSLRGGDASSLRGGDRSSLIGGNGSSLRGGNASKFCGEKWSTFFVEIRDNYGNITSIATVIVDDINIKANQWYVFNAEVGEWAECDAPDNAIN